MKRFARFSCALFAVGCAHKQEPHTPPAEEQVQTAWFDEVFAAGATAKVQVLPSRIRQHPSLGPLFHKAVSVAMAEGHRAASPGVIGVAERSEAVYVLTDDRSHATFCIRGVPADVEPEKVWADVGAVKSRSLGVAEELSIADKQLVVFVLPTRAWVVTEDATAGPLRQVFLKAHGARLGLPEPAAPVAAVRVPGLILRRVAHDRSLHQTAPLTDGVKGCEGALSETEVTAEVRCDYETDAQAAEAERVARMAVAVLPAVKHERFGWLSGGELVRSGSALRLKFPIPIQWLTAL